MAFVISHTKLGYFKRIAGSEIEWTQKIEKAQTFNTQSSAHDRIADLDARISDDDESPVVVGRFEVVPFSISGKPLRTVLTEKAPRPVSTSSSDYSAEGDFSWAMDE